MGKRVSRLSIIFAIIKKDFFEIFRDKLWVYLSTIGILLYVLIYWLLPSTVDETLVIGIYQNDMDEILQEYSEQEEGLKFVEFESSQDLQKTIEGELENEEDVNIGIVFPDDFLQKSVLGEKSKVEIYTDTSVPKEIRNAMTSFIREMTFGIHSAIVQEDSFPVELPDEEQIILGEDRVGDQIAFRQRLKPLFAFFILLVESMALASLIAVEIQTRTITAILATPARLIDLLLAKTIFGTLLAFSQAVILLLLIGALGQNPLMLLAMILLGAIMVTGFAFISGSAGKDFMGTLLYSVLFLIPLMVPAFAVLFPGSASLWIQILPTYGLVEGIIKSTAYLQTWSEVAPYFLMVIAWNIVILSAGLIIFKNRVKKL